MAKAPTWDETAEIPSWDETEDVSAPKVKPSNLREDATLGEPSSAGNSIFRTASRVEAKGAKGVAAKGVLGVLDILNTPAAAAAKLRGQSMSDPDPYLLKPETEAIKAKVERFNDAHPSLKKIPNLFMPGLFGNTVGDVAPKVIETAGRTGSDPLVWLGPLLKTIQGGARGANKIVGRVAEEASGVPEEALRMASTKPGRQALQAAAGKERQIGEQLLTRIENFDEYLPERQQVSEALEKMGPISVESAIATLEKAKGPVVAGRISPEKAAANSSIEKYIRFLRGGDKPDDLTALASEAKTKSEGAVLREALLGSQSKADAKAAANAAKSQKAAQSEMGKIAAEIKNRKNYGTDFGWWHEESLQNAKQAAAQAKESAILARSQAAIGKMSQADLEAAQAASQVAERSALIADAASRLYKGEPLPTVAKALAGETGLSVDDLQSIITQARAKAQSIPELPPQTVSAKDYRRLRQDLDVPVNWQEEGAGIKNEALKAGRTTMKNELLKKAEESGIPGYAEAMRAWSGKLDKLEEIKGVLGKTSSTRDRRVESFIDNLFGKNSEYKQQLMKDLDEIFQSDLTKQAKAAQLASEVGPGGVPTWFPRQSTGRSGSIYDILRDIIRIGSTPVGGFVLSSPKIASRATLPAFQGLENLALTTRKVPKNVQQELVRNAVERAILAPAQNPLMLPAEEIYRLPAVAQGNGTDGRR